MAIDTGDVVFGDGHVDQGATRTLAISAVRAGIDDVQAAYELGAAGAPATGEPLYRAVRCVTDAPADRFVAEAKIPRLSPANPAQNWRAPDIETLCNTPIVASSATTVGQALADMLVPDGYFIRQLDCLGQGLVVAYGLLAAPIVGDWIARRGCRAYHRGFVDVLAADPSRSSSLSPIQTPRSSPGPAAGATADPTQECNRR